MELGTGFAYMGREVRIEVGETEKYIDMLFYNTQRHCYVAVSYTHLDVYKRQSMKSTIAT